MIHYINVLFCSHYWYDYPYYPAAIQHLTVLTRLIIVIHSVLARLWEGRGREVGCRRESSEKRLRKGHAADGELDNDRNVRRHFY